MTRVDARSQPRAGLVAALFASCASVLVLGFLACSDEPLDPTSAEQVLIGQAIEAMWGEKDPASVTAFRSTSTFESDEPSFLPDYHLDTLVAGKDRYREVRRWNAIGVTEVFCLDKGLASLTFDDTAITLDAGEIERRRLQPWLFQVSKLAPLRDASSFKLEHLGKSELEDKTAIESLRVSPKGKEGAVLTLDFDVKSHLLKRVSMAGEDSAEDMSLRLGDYRSVEGVQVAYSLESFRGDKAIAKQQLTSVEFNPKIDESMFKAVQDAPKFSLKASASGLVALSPLGDDDVDDRIDDMKTWILKNDLRLAGPLIVRHPLINTAEESSEANAARQVCIAVRRVAEKTTAATKDESIDLVKLESHQALCVTIVEETEDREVQELLIAEAKKRNLKPSEEPVLELWLKRDGKIRQIQMPVVPLK